MSKENENLLEKNHAPVHEKKLDIFEQGRLNHPEDDDIIVKMRDMRVAFKIGSIERVIINHLDLDIKRGEILGLVGESGSGKTTIGRALIRINTVSGGVVTYNNVPISGKIPKETERLLKTKMQMIFQDPGDSLNDRANIDYIVSEGLRAFKLFKNEEERLEKVTKMMERVGLRAEYLTRYPHEFSGGQRQRIGIARALASSPEFIMCDEPVSALDVSIQAQILNTFQDLQKQFGLTYLFVAHNLLVVKHISDRIAVMYLGHIVELANSQELYDNPLHPYTISLLSSIPEPDPKKARANKRQILEGDIPSPLKAPSGCPFRTRCPKATPECANKLPELREISKEHFVACRLFDEQSNTIYNAERLIQVSKKYSEGAFWKKQILISIKEEML